MTERDPDTGRFARPFTPNVRKPSPADDARARHALNVDWSKPRYRPFRLWPWALFAMGAAGVVLAAFAADALAGWPLN